MVAITAVAIGLACVVGCSSGPRLPRGTGSVQPAQYGATAADDPQAALIGRDIISTGGTAADAAVAMYFTMAVTSPANASLGGGGLCLVFSAADKKVETLDFLPRSPGIVPPTADRPSAVPGNPRGFFALHARFGRMRWSELLAPAENLARFGTPVSRQLDRDLAPMAPALAGDPEFRRIFGRADGNGLVGDGDTVVQLDLATSIARLRTETPSEFYTGQSASQLVAATLRAGGSLDRADLAAMLPSWNVPIVVTANDLKAYFPSVPPLAGGIEGQMWAILAGDDHFADASPAERVHLLAEAAIRAFAAADRGETVTPGDKQALVSAPRIAGLFTDYSPRRRSTPTSSTVSPRLETPAGAGLIAVDGSGNAVACTVTMNNLFGTGRIAPGTGIVLAADPGTGGRGSAMLAPMIATDDKTRYFYYASTAAGGVAAPQALMNVAARTLLADQPLAEAMAYPRLVALPETERVLVEESMNGADTAALQQAGHVPVPTRSLGQINAIFCPGGVPDRPDLCVPATDKRGFGVALTTR